MANKLQFASDLHLDHRTRAGAIEIIDRLLRIDANVIAIAGDFAAATTPIWASAMEKLLAYCDHVIYVPGNHEYYNSTPAECHEIFSAMAARSSRFHWLDFDYVTISGVTFAGASLWFQDCTEVQVHKKGLNDFNYIREFTPWVFEQSARAREFFANSTANVFISHHLPSERSVASHYKGKPLNCFYVNDVITGAYHLPKLWIHGHTHNACDYPLPSPYPNEECRVVCNPIGYPGQMTGFMNSWVFDFDAMEAIGMIDKLTPARRPAPPSKLIADELTARRWTIDDLAQRSGLTVKTIIEVLYQGEPVDETIADGLSLAFGTSINLWLNLQRNYQQYLMFVPKSGEIQ
jgi:plasmid maintenance system antidote protein VapI/Icc-related predicted phosphoesterase